MTITQSMSTAITQSMSTTITQSMCTTITQSMSTTIRGHRQISHHASVIQGSFKWQAENNLPKFRSRAANSTLGRERVDSTCEGVFPSRIFFSKAKHHQGMVQHVCCALRREQRVSHFPLASPSHLISSQFLFCSRSTGHRLHLTSSPGGTTDNRQR